MRILNTGPNHVHGWIGDGGGGGGHLSNKSEFGWSWQQRNNFPLRVERVENSKFKFKVKGIMELDKTTT